MAGICSRSHSELVWKLHASSSYSGASAPCGWCLRRGPGQRGWEWVRTEGRAHRKQRASLVRDRNLEVSLEEDLLHGALLDG